MKKLRLAFAGCALLAAAGVSNLSAQDSKFRFGIRLQPSITFSSLSFDNASPKNLETGSRAQFGGGIEGNYYFGGGKFGLTFGLDVTGRSFTWQFNSGTANGLGTGIGLYQQYIGANSANLTFSNIWLQIPLGVKGRSPEIIKNFRIRGSVTINPSFAVGKNVNSDEDMIDFFSPYLPLKKGDNKISLVSTFDIGPAISIGAEYTLEKVGTFDVGIIYYHGLVNVMNTSYSYNNVVLGQELTPLGNLSNVNGGGGNITSTGYSAKLRNIGLQIGYFF
jgi:hypothetical protein